jgi:threonine dehydrogenase-like Zn-dependent dehydrogenase
MKATVLTSYSHFDLLERPDPVAGKGEVVVRIRFASICGSDMHIFHGDFHPRTPVPFIPGHEMGGVIETVGEGVTDFVVGEKVAIDPIIWCGKCPACLEGHYPACTSLKLIGIDLDGGFCERISVPASMLFKAGSSVPDEQVALAEIYAIGFHANNRAGTHEGQKVAIWGAGRVGQVILQAARIRTNETIFIVDPVQKRLDIAAQYNQNVITINPLKNNPVQVIRELTGGKGVDIAFEAVGHADEINGLPNPVRCCIQSIKGGGLVCVLGLGDDPAPVLFKEMIWKEARIIASRVSHGEFAEVLDSLEKGLLKPEAMISAILPGTQIQEAFGLLDHDKSNYLKILLDFTTV